MRNIPCEKQYANLKTELVGKVFNKFGGTVADKNVRQYIDREILDDGNVNCFIVEYAVQAIVFLHFGCSSENLYANTESKVKVKEKLINGETVEESLDRAVDLLKAEFLSQSCQKNTEQLISSGN